MRRVLGVALVVECHGLERQNRFAGFVHRFNFLFESPRGADRAQLAGGVYHYCYGVCVAGCHPTNAGDEGSCLARADADGVRVVEEITSVADEDIVIAKSKTAPGSGAQCDVVAAEGQKEKRTRTDGRVIVAAHTVIERSSTDNRVVAAGAVVIECSKPIGRVV